MGEQALTEVRVMRRFSAPPERVFDAWLDASTLGNWLFATPTGEMVRVEVDPRPGGAFEIVERRDGQDVAHIGTYVELDRPRRLVFTLAVPRYSDDSARVAVDIAPSGDNSELTLSTHAESDDVARRAEAGWGGVLEGLARQLD
jgi:uncharacterized protein YndB with AHSA1/START domain